MRAVVSRVLSASVTVDQEVVGEIGVGLDRERARVVVQAVIQLVRGAGCEIVAEAVETVPQADILRSMACDVVQGHVFAHPMFEEEFLNWTTNAARGHGRSVA